MLWYHQRTMLTRMAHSSSECSPRRESTSRSFLNGYTMFSSTCFEHQQSYLIIKLRRVQIKTLDKRDIIFDKRVIGEEVVSSCTIILCSSISNYAAIPKSYFIFTTFGLMRLIPDASGGSFSNILIDKYGF